MAMIITFCHLCICFMCAIKINKSCLNLCIFCIFTECIFGYMYQLSYFLILHSKKYRGILTVLLLYLLLENKKKSQNRRVEK